MQDRTETTNYFDSGVYRCGGRRVRAGRVGANVCAGAVGLNTTPSLTGLDTPGVDTLAKGGGGKLSQLSRHRGDTSSNKEL